MLELMVGFWGLAMLLVEESSFPVGKFGVQSSYIVRPAAAWGMRHFIYS